MSLHDHDLLRLQDALDGRLSEFEQAAVARHLVSCEACRRRSQALRWTTLRLAGAAGMSVPPTLADDVASALTLKVPVTASPPPLPASAPPLPAPPAPRGWRAWRGWRARLFGG